MEWSGFYCCTPKALYNHVEVSHVDDATAAKGQGRQCAHQLQVERRESIRANQVDGDY